MKMNAKRWSSALMAGIMTVGLLSGCSSTGDKAPAPPASSGKTSGETAELTPSGKTLMVGVQSSIISVPTVYAEEKGYFDELREEALTKPDAELSISRNFIAVKIGKRNLIKLLIKRGVTVAEFMLESEELKKLRLSNKNKRGKSSIKVKPTTVQVIDLMSLKVAVDMLNLAYEELMLDD